MSSLGEMLPLEYVGPLAGGGAVPLGMCLPGSFMVPPTCNSGSHTAGDGCQPTGYATGGAWCNLGNGTCLN